MRLAAGLILLSIGCALVVLAWGPLQNLFGYRDSPVSTYLLFGVPLLLAAGMAFFGAWQLLRG